MAGATASMGNPFFRPPGRLGLAVLAGLVITAGLYLLMHSLIATGRGAMQEEVTGRVVEFVRLDQQEQLRTKDRKPDRPPKPEEAPDVPPVTPDNVGPADSAMSIGDMSHQARLDRGQGLAVGEGDYLPIVKVAPMYPMRARQRGIEGWVLLEFTVTKTGTVKDPKVIESKPSGVFDRAAKNAVVKFKYKPRVVDGQAVEVPGVRHRITFELED